MATQTHTVKKDIKKLQTNRQFLAILILLFVALLFWVTVSLITSQTSERISAELTQLSRPLTPVIDTTVLDDIEGKRNYSESELSGFTIYKVLTSRDGRTERVVPIEVTIDDLEPIQTEDEPEEEQTPSLLDQFTQEESDTSQDTETSPLGEETGQNQSDTTGTESPAPETTESPEPTASPESTASPAI